MKTVYSRQAFGSKNGPKSGSVQVTMERIEIGDIMLPTGQIVACDPIHLYDLDPFAHQITPGRYPVVLSVAQARHSRVRRVAYATLVIADEAPVRWQLAAKARQHVDETEDDSLHGYGVDVALGSFMDIKAAELLRIKMDENDRYHNYIFEQVEGNTPEWANISLDPDTGLNFTVFGTGFGDGIYISYWGYDGFGNIACLLTDFELFTKAAQEHSNWAWG